LTECRTRRHIYVMDETPERKASSDPTPTAARADERPPAVRVTAAKCVRCGKPVQARTRPFCSQRCADIDLGNWIGGTYRVVSDEGPGGPDDGSADGGA
jgi:uncharacterized protein